MGGVFVSARAANKGANFWQAYLVRALATAAFAMVALEGLKQVSSVNLADVSSGVGVGGEAGIGAQTGGEGVRGVLDPSVAGGGVAGGGEGLCQPGGGDGGTAGGVSCSAEVVVEAVAAAGDAIADASKVVGGGAWVEAVVGWVGGVREAFEAGEWREKRLRVEEFWGWASVAAYLTLVEALPVLLAPLHGIFK